MKQFLVLTAILPLMLVFFLQFAMDQQNSARVQAVSDLVYAAKEEARQEGCFTNDIKQRLASSIAGRLGISPSDVVIDADSSVKYRLEDVSGLTDGQLERGMIHYRVTVPVGRMMAGRSLFGLKEEGNVYCCTIEGRAASERLRR
ncbi:MAG: hypothetical protein IIU32_09400 [Firmicutes bacterium]|nr:hypothetical protein [Bacillota bacterium]